MIALVLSLVLAGGDAGLTVAATPAPGEDAAVTVRAKEWFTRVQKGDIDRPQLTDDMNAALPTDKEAQLAASLRPLGDPTMFVFLGKTTLGVFTVYQYDVTCPNGELVFTFALDQAGKVAGIHFKPK